MNALPALAAIDPLVGYLGGAAIAALGVYVVTLRRLSGKIVSSDATQLWAESSAIRAALREDVKALSERLERLELRNLALVEENGQLKLEIRELRSTITECHEQIADCSKELEAAQRRVSELEREARDGRS